MWLAAWVVVFGEFLGIVWLGWLYSRHAIVITVDKGADIATLVLASATLVLTGVAVAVAVVTIWGFREIRTRAVDAAVKAAMEATRDSIRRAVETGDTSQEEATEIAAGMDSEEGDRAGN
jgi:hypothetical protein